jgi:hypothetical protein
MPVHDLTQHQAEEPPAFQQYLRGEPIPECYAESQQLARELLDAQSNGILYPSVRQARGACLVCFRPALVYFVRRGARLEIALQAGIKFTPRQAREIEYQEQ